MKKSFNKLSLGKITISNLDHASMEQKFGGEEPSYIQTITCWPKEPVFTKDKVSICKDTGLCPVHLPKN